jgi:hypothetical protein
VTRARAAAAATGAAEADIAKEDIVATGPSTGTRVRCSGVPRLGYVDDRSVGARERSPKLVAQKRGERISANSLEKHTHTFTQE